MNDASDTSIELNQQLSMECFYEQIYSREWKKYNQSNCQRDHWDSVSNDV